MHTAHAQFPGAIVLEPEQEAEDSGVDHDIAIGVLIELIFSQLVYREILFLHSIAADEDDCLYKGYRDSLYVLGERDVRIGSLVVHEIFVVAVLDWGADN